MNSLLPVLRTHMHVVFMLLALVMTGGAFAEDEAPAEGEEAEAAPPAPAIYLPIKPAFVVNYGGPGRLRYLKTEMSVRVNTIDAANAVRHHLPFVRNNLVMLFAQQTNETVSSQDGREALRISALEEVRNVVEKENMTPREDIIDVYFNTFIVQK